MKRERPPDLRGATLYRISNDCNVDDDSLNIRSRSLDNVHQ
jgi:hypothetical protein